MLRYCNITSLNERTQCTQLLLQPNSVTKHFIILPLAQSPQASGSRFISGSFSWATKNDSTNRLLTRPCTKRQPERRHQQQTDKCTEKLNWHFWNWSSEELKLLRKSFSLFGIACATQVNTAAYNQAWIWPSSWNICLSLISAATLQHCNLWFKHACPLLAQLPATLLLAVKLLLALLTQSCSKWKGKFSHSPVWTQSPNLCSTGTHNKDEQTVCQCRKDLWLLQNLRSAAKTRLHTSLRRCKCHLNSCSGPKQLAKLSSQ